MNYELAKELKDAGFPQTSEEEWWKFWKFPKVKKPKKNPRDDKEWKAVGYELHRKPKQDNSGYWELIASNPTLSELIEARASLGTFKMWALKSGRGAVQEEGQSLDIVEEYVTLEEAVARSWLALNKKDKSCPDDYNRR